MNTITPAGREWLMQLADFFAAYAGQAVLMDEGTSRIAAEKLREIAATADPEALIPVPEPMPADLAELERWYREAGSK